MDYIIAKEMAVKWGVTTRCVQLLCEKGKIEGVVKFGNTWAIPKDAEKPLDKRFKKNKIEKRKEDEEDGKA